MDTIILTRPLLRKALIQWEQDHRDGKTRPDAEVAAMPVEQVADENVEHLWAKMTAEA